MVFIFSECKLQKLCQVQVKLLEFSLPVPRLVTHFLSVNDHRVWGCLISIATTLLVPALAAHDLVGQQHAAHLRVLVLALVDDGLFGHWIYEANIQILLRSDPVAVEQLDFIEDAVVGLLVVGLVLFLHKVHKTVLTHVPFQNQLNFYKASLVLLKFVL